MKETKRVKGIFLGMTGLLVLMLTPLVCHGDSAEVLPKGIFSFDTAYYHYFDIKERYNPEGKAEDLAVDYNKELNSNVFPALAPLNPFVGGNATLGRSVVDFTLVVRKLEFSLYYGLTDKITVGVLAPYSFLKNKVDASLDSSTANVGKNPYLNSLAPLYVPGTQPLNTNDIQNLLGNGLDINGDGKIDIAGFGYKQVKTWSGNGFEDIELLGRYQFYNKGDWRLAFTGGVRLPTGQVDDPDNLTDFQFGDGQTDILLRFNADFLGIKRLVLNGTIRYDIQLPDRQEKRVPDAVDKPITANKEDVKRNLGDIIQLEFMGRYDFTQGLSGGLKYLYVKKFKDHVDGNQGFNYSSLEDETNTESQNIYVFLGYSTLPIYIEKKFPVPLGLKLEYRNRFAGKNNALKSQYIAFTAGVFF
jgi:hypothetical protein